MTLKQAGLVFITAILLSAFFWMGLTTDLPEKSASITLPCVNHATPLPEKPVQRAEEEFTVTVNGVGVFENQTEGEIVHIIMTSKKGSGKVLIDFSSGAYVGTDLQESVLLARMAASEYTGQLSVDKDYYITFDSMAREVSGASGTAGIAAGFVALSERKGVRNDTAVTGFIYENQSLGSVDLISDKIRIAEEEGMKTMIIPATQCNKTLEENTSIKLVCAHNLSEVVNNLLE